MREVVYKQSNIHQYFVTNQLEEFSYPTLKQYHWCPIEKQRSSMNRKSIRYLRMNGLTVHDNHPSPITAVYPVSIVDEVAVTTPH